MDMPDHFANRSTKSLNPVQVADLHLQSPQKKLLIATTVPDTIATILKGQPKWLKEHFDVALMTSPGKLFSQIADTEEITPLLVPMNRRISLLTDIRSIFVAFHKIRRLRPDIVHSYTPKAGLVTMLAAFLARVPIRIHSFTGLIFPTSRGFKRLLLMGADWLICRSATHIIAEGKGVASDLAGAKITTKPLNVLANGNVAGVDLNHYSASAPGVRMAAREIKARFGIAAQTPVLGYVGRLNLDKGINELVTAIHSVNSTRSTRAIPHCKLLCVGELDASAPIAPHTKALMEDDSDIILAGWHNDIRPFLAAMDVLILPSYREGFPNVLLQGGAMGLPLIATNINGSNEIIVHRETGLLVPPHDAHALSGAILTFLNSTEAERAKMGAAGQRRIQHLFSQTMVRNALLEFYLGLSERVQTRDERNSR